MSAGRPLRLALGLLTRVPVNVGPAQPAELGAAVGYFGAVGAVLGAGLVAAAEVLGGALPPPVLAVVLVAGLAAVTGGLHLDGVADVFDGLGGGRGDRERTLNIMKDPRVGAHGVVAVVLVLFTKVAALAYLLPEAPGQVSAHVWAFPIAARAAASMAATLFPAARPDGLGAAFSAHAGPREFNLAMVTLLAATALLGLDIALPAVVAIGVGASVAQAANARLGGLTGDVYGAIIELAELGYLLCAVA